MSARHLADYMAASERASRTIVRTCKYQPIARVVQHDEAKAAVSEFIRRGDGDTGALLARAQELRNRLADDDFEQSVNDINADYITHFAGVAPSLSLPEAEVLASGFAPPVEINGVKVTVDLGFRLRRITRTNKVRIGAGALRYAKGKALPQTTAEWQSAFLFAYLGLVPPEEAADPEHRLCLTVCAHSAECYPAPTDSVSRFRNMEAALASIAERWANVAPPPNAVL